MWHQITVCAVTGVAEAEAATHITQRHKQTVAPIKPDQDACSTPPHSLTPASDEDASASPYQDSRSGVQLQDVSSRHQQPKAEPADLKREGDVQTEDIWSNGRAAD